MLCSSAWADQTTHYTIIFSGEARGEQVTTVGADGRIKVDYQYSQNGRGPTLREDIQLAADGTFARYKVTGKSTFGAPVHETFVRHGEQVEWKSHSDKGKKTVSGAATYLPVESSSEADAVIVRALTRQPGGRLAAVPGGELSAQRVATQTLESQGRSVNVALYAVTGVSTEPTWLWLTDDSEQRFFCYVYPGWMRVIEKGWEAGGDTLEARQVAAEREWLEKLAGRLTHRFDDPIVFRNVRVFDSRNARLLDPADVYVQGGHIAAIYETGSTARENVVEIDGTGRVLSPALFDMHTHEGPWNSVLQIAGGVTTSRDMGTDNATLAALAARIDRGEVVGPRIAPAGFIEGKSEFFASGGFVAESLQDAKDAVDWYAQHGYRQIKIYNSFRPEWVEPTAAYAHQRGLRVSGHVPAFMRAEEAVRAGYDEIQHINQVMLNFLVKPTDDTRTLTRFYLMTEHARDIDVDSPQVQDFLKLLKERGTTIDNTAAVFEGLFLQRQGQTDPGFVSVAANLPVGLQRSLRTNSMDVNDKNATQYRESWERVLQFIGRMHAAGIPFVAGTDGMAGFTLHRELELYVQAGLTPAEALQVATWNGAKYTGLLDQLGSIERGKRADVILIDGDPAQDISAIRRISLVMKDGVVFYPAEVYEAVGVKRFVDPPALKALTAAPQRTP
jgi:cytosine/adenosine deaminase-related metal-dependent hydrolase